MAIHENNFLRMFVLPLLKVFAFDFSLSHHWTRDRIRLNSFRHKGYWYHGRSRELPSMKAFGLLVSEGDTVIEVGGHVGYLSLWFAQLVGPSGKVIVFEPGQNNLPYIRKNIRSKRNVLLVEKGCGPKAEVMKFYEDDLTGQNNSFVKNFAGLEENSRSAPGISLKVGVKDVEVCRVDEFAVTYGLSVDFVKIDTEGYEFSVLVGCARLFNQKRPPKFMVEVQADEAAILTLFTAHGYELFSDAGIGVFTVESMLGNIFALHPQHHAEAIARWKSVVGSKKP